MNKKGIAIIIIFLALAIIGGIAYFVFFNKNEAEQSKNVNQPVNQGSDQNPVANNNRRTAVVEFTNEIAQPKTEAEVSQADLKRIAGSFTERYGSFSNQSDFSNIKDLKIFMSDRMKRWADNYIAQQIEKGGDSTIYYGITTKAITQTVNDFNEESGKAEILVKSQRREAIGASGNTSVAYQDIIIKFVKENGAWKVDDAQWMEMEKQNLWTTQ